MIWAFIGVGIGSAIIGFGVAVFWIFALIAKGMNW